jgi:hypothetical protein
MYEGQLLVYRYNGLHNVGVGAPRNDFQLKSVQCSTPEEFRGKIQDALDEIPDNRGYVLVKYNNQLYLTERDGESYIRRAINYHPLQDKFEN